MKQLRFSSFRQRLNAAFLAVSLVPVLLCSTSSRTPSSS